MIPYIELLSLVAAYLFIIYGLEKAVEDRDDVMIFLGVLVQIGVTSGIAFWTHEITGVEIAALLVGPLSVAGIYPVLQGIRRNIIFPAEIQIEIESSLDPVDPGPFVPIHNPFEVVFDGDENKGQGD